MAKSKWLTHVWIGTVMASTLLGVACADQGFHSVVKTKSTTSQIASPMSGDLAVTVTPIQEGKTRSTSFVFDIVLGSQKVSLATASNYKDSSMTVGSDGRAAGQYNFDVSVLCGDVSCNRFVAVYTVALASQNNNITQTAILYEWDGSTGPSEVIVLPNSNFNSAEPALPALESMAQYH